MDIVKEAKDKVNKLWDDNNLDSIARETGFMRRKRKITAKNFLENITLLELSGTKGTLEEFAYEFHQADCAVTKQALHKKINGETVKFLQKVLEQLLKDSCSKAGINLEAISFLERIQVIDSSEIKLHKKLQNIFPQVRHQGAAVKLQAIMDVVQERLLSLEIRASKEPDQAYQKHKLDIQPGDLMITDLGYFCVKTFKEIAVKEGFFLSRYFKKASLYTLENNPIDLRAKLSQAKGNYVEFPVLLGAEKLPCRCVAIRLTDEAYQKRLQHIKREKLRDPRRLKQEDVLDQWTIFVTNLPASLDGETLLQIYSLRWQIELLFKMMKTFLRLRKIEHTNQYSTLISLYVSLIAAVVICLISASITDKEISLQKAGKFFIRNIRKFINYIRNGKQCVVDWLSEMLRKFALKESRQQRPSTKLKLQWKPSHGV